jgi:putative YjhG/YagF family dehydratase
VADWQRVNGVVPRLVDVLPNGPTGHPTIQAFLAGGVPEVMLHLRDLDLLHLDALTVHGRELGDLLDEWQSSERRKRLRERLFTADGIDPDNVIMDPETAATRGLTSTVTFPTGNLAPEGSVIKSTAIDPSVVDDDGIYRNTGPARVFVSEREAIAAIKGNHEKPVQAGDILVLIGRGPMGSGMEETYQLTSALRYLPFGKQVALITDARFSGVSTGACIGHIGPEALAGGAIGRVREGDTIQIEVDTVNLRGSLNLINPPARNGSGSSGNGVDSSAQQVAGSQLLAGRSLHPDLTADPRLPDDTRLWAALQAVSGGTWAGCVYDTDRILEVLAAGEKALAQ